MSESARVIFDIPVVGSSEITRAICDHENGKWSIVTTKRNGTDAKVEQTYTFDEVRIWAEMVLEGNPDANKRQGLGRMLAAGVLTMFVGMGIIQTQKGKS